MFRTRTASQLNNQLRDLSTNISSMVEDMNKVIGKNTTDQLSFEGTDSLASITQILGAHVSSLGWINETTEGLNVKVGELEKRMSGQSLGGSTSKSGLGGSRRR